MFSERRTRAATVRERGLTCESGSPAPLRSRLYFGKRLLHRSRKLEIAARPIQQHLSRAGSTEDSGKKALGIVDHAHMRYRRRRAFKIDGRFGYDQAHFGSGGERRELSDRFAGGGIP